MKNAKKSKLTLKKELVKKLSQDQLSVVVGGNCLILGNLTA